MLERLKVQGLGIIDDVAVELAPGFVVLTGETGAGKSLLVESLKLLAGQRASVDMVRSGDDRLGVEGCFAPVASLRLTEVLEELGIPWSDTLVLRRELTAAGRSRCWVNDAAVTVAGLGRIGAELLSIHGQHEQYGLGDAAVQRRLVDEFGGHEELLETTRRAWGDWREAAAEVERLRTAQVERRDRLDAISFQIAEIDTLAPQPGEDEELIQRRQVLRHSARLHELAADVLGRLDESEAPVGAELARAARAAEEMARCGLPAADASARLTEARVVVEEVVRDLRAALDSVSDDPSELEGVESRLFALEQLMLKYGSPLEQVLEHRRALAAEQRELAEVSDRLEEALASAAAALAEYDRAAAALDEARAAAGEALAGAVEGILGSLAMAGTTVGFLWQLTDDPTSPLQRDGRPVAFDGEGVATCELLIAPNPGEEPRAMARIASGGELSRLHLALRTALRRRQGTAPRTLLFDEVDSGLGGAAAAALAELLADLATEDQVLVVTHLPQVAARAATHLRVGKEVSGGRAVTRAEPLDEDARVDELARMLAGDTSSARAHARALLESG